MIHQASMYFEVLYSFFETGEYFYSTIDILGDSGPVQRSIDSASFRF